MENTHEEKQAQAAWPRNQFHPAYESFTQWLDAEAPPITPPEAKFGNRPRYRKWRRSV